MTAKTKQTFTAEEKAEYRKAQHDEAAQLLKTAAQDLLTSEGWRRWALLRSRLHNYSPQNVMLILAQMPEASMVASFRFWKDETDRSILKGSRALRVFAPLFRKPTEEDLAAGHPADQKVLYGFKLVPVFDVSQTEGPELPIPVSEPITGDSHAELLPRLETFARTLGFTVSYEDLSAMGAGGYCDPQAKRIVVEQADAANSQVRTLVHEIAHALGVGYKEYGRQAAEVIVETATFIVLTGAGLDTSASTVPYVAGWGEADGVAAIDTFAAVVSAVAKKIEAAIA